MSAHPLQWPAQHHLLSGLRAMKRWLTAEAQHLEASAQSLRLIWAYEGSRIISVYVMGGSTSEVLGKQSILFIFNTIVFLIW